MNSQSKTRRRTLSSETVEMTPFVVRGPLAGLSEFTVCPQSPDLGPLRRTTVPAPIGSHVPGKEPLE